MKICSISGLSRACYPKGIVQFMGAGGDCCLELCNFRAKKLSWDELRNFWEEDCQEELCNSRAQLGLRNFWREGWFPSRIVQFLEGAAQPTTDNKSRKWLVKGVEQDFMYKLTRLYETDEDDVIDSVRNAAKDGR